MADVFKAVEEIFMAAEESKKLDELPKPNPIDKYFQEEDARNALSLKTSTFLQEYAQEEARKKAKVENSIIELNENFKKFVATKTETESGAAIKPKKPPSKRTRKDNLQTKHDESQGKPQERQEFLYSIWDKLGRSARNMPVWKELRVLAGNGNQTIRAVTGNDDFTYAYQDGTIRPLSRKTFQTDMSIIRKTYPKK